MMEVSFDNILEYLFHNLPFICSQPINRQTGPFIKFYQKIEIEAFKTDLYKNSWTRAMEMSKQMPYF